MEKSNKTDEIIKDHVITAMAAGAIPVPVADLAAVSAVHLNLIKSLTIEMGGQYDNLKGRALISSLITGTTTRAGASFIKLLPGVGTILGITSQVILSGAVTYALGRLLVSAYQRGENLDTISTDAVKDEFKEHVKKGKKFASSLKKTKEYEDKVKEQEEKPEQKDVSDSESSGEDENNIEAKH